MKPLLPLAIVCAAILAPAPAASASQDKGVPDKDGASKAPNEIQVSPSAFVDSPQDPNYGKDIFFPQSKRTARKAAQPEQNAATRESQILAQLTLKGISGKANKRLAVVNNRTLAQGEVWEFKANGQVHRIRCEEIKARSVVLSIEGFTEKKELQLRGGL